MIFGGSDSDSDLTTIRINIFSTINIVNKIDVQCLDISHYFRREGRGED